VRARGTKVSLQVGKYHGKVYLQALLVSFIRSLIFLYAAVPTTQVLCLSDDSKVKEKLVVEYLKGRTCYSL